jgi:preprotein translocase subunit SecG
MTFAYYLVMTLFVVVALVLMLLVLIQKGRGGGLASAFGGMGGNTAFGAKTGDVLTWATSVIFGLFLVLAIVLNLVANSLHARNTGPVSVVAPAAPAAPGQPDGGAESAPRSILPPPQDAPREPSSTSPPAQQGEPTTNPG